MIPFIAGIFLWFGLAGLGLALLVGPIVAAILFIFLINIQGNALIAVTTALAIWGAHTGLNLSLLPAILLGMPLVPAIYMVRSMWLSRGYR